MMVHYNSRAMPFIIPRSSANETLYHMLLFVGAAVQALKLPYFAKETDGLL